MNLRKNSSIETCLSVFGLCAFIFSVADGFAPGYFHRPSISRNSFAPTFLRPSRGGDSTRSSGKRPYIASLRVVADAEDIDKDRGKRKHDEEETVSSSWIETGTGGFLPNFGSRKISEVATIEDYKKVVVEEPDLLVCVRFYAPWCRACKAVSSRFQRLANEYPTVKFVECPLTKENAYLHQGLGVPSLPYAHIYHPTAGLVEERKINKNVFAEFKNKVLKSYLDGSCPIEYDDEKDGKESLQ
jgi:thiol-disulfide isomerase/thioredoxin